jgi:hypothetical protein
MTLGARAPRLAAPATRDFFARRGCIWSRSTGAPGGISIAHGLEASKDRGDITMMEKQQVSAILEDLLVATVGYQELIEDIADDLDLAMRAPARSERALRARAERAELEEEPRAERAVRAGRIEGMRAERALRAGYGEAQRAERVRAERALRGENLRALRALLARRGEE